MVERDFVLSCDLGSWMIYSMSHLDMTENEAIVEWRNHHNKGKYLICEARENDTTRLFIRNTTNVLSDAFHKEGWWDTFTVTKNKTTKGLWLSKVVKYRIDRNGYINLEVETVVPIDGVQFHKLFSFEPYEGTWNSIAWYFMIVCSKSFISDYNFNYANNHNPNYEALEKKFPELSGLTVQEMGQEMLIKYLRKEVTLSEIEEPLNELTDWERLIKNLQRAVMYDDLSSYETDFPIFTKKLYHNVVTGDIVYRDVIESYLYRQLDYYYELVRNDKISPVQDENNTLAKIEEALKYRKSLKDQEKTERKKKRKKK